MEKQGNGYVLHHINPLWKSEDIERYKQWNVEDLIMLTREEHSSLHANSNNNPMYGKHHSNEAKLKQGKACKDKHHYFKGNENRMFYERPDETWEVGIYSEKDNRRYGENNGMYGKSVYEGKSEEELNTIKQKKQHTFYSKSKEEQEEINGRRGFGLAVVCMNTGEFFRSVSLAVKKYKNCCKAYKCSKQDYCYAGLFNGERLKWRKATKEEIQQNEKRTV